MLHINGSDVRGENFPQSNVRVRVFNRDFINENVFPVGSGELPPILVLGAENVERQQEVERLNEQRAPAQSKLEFARDTKESTRRDLNQLCIDRAKVVKDTLRSSGQNPYNNYDKSNFQRDAEQMVRAGKSTAHRLSEAEREALLAQHRAAPKPKVAELAHALPDFNAITERLSRFLNGTVASAAIEVLKGDSSLADWIRQGLALHRDRSSERCQFCEQPLPNDRLAALEAHFSNQYEQFLQRIDQEINELQALSTASAEIQLPHRADFYDDLGPEFESSEAELTKTLAAAQSFLAAAVQALKDKKHQVFEEVRAAVQRPQVDPCAVERVNSVVQKHNQASDDFETRVEEARKLLAADLIAAEAEEFIRRKGAENRADAEEQTQKQAVQHLVDEVARLEREIVEHRRPAEELNQDLGSYLGHRELCLEIRETGYTITRSGVPAQSLSEGETTAIALLYFLKSLQDRRFEPANGIIVLDDPVSSLDANALFLAFGFIRERTKDAGQLFVLTHNFSFFRLIRNWFHHLKGQHKKGAVRLNLVHRQNLQSKMLRLPVHATRPKRWPEAV